MPVKPTEALVCRFVAASPSLRRCSGRLPSTNASQHSSDPHQQMHLLARVAESPSRPAVVQPKAPRHRCYACGRRLTATATPRTDCTDTRHASSSAMGHGPSRSSPGGERPSETREPPAGRPGGHINGIESPCPAHVGVGVRSNVRATPPRSIANETTTVPQYQASYG